MAGQASVQSQLSSVQADVNQQIKSVEGKVDANQTMLDQYQSESSQKAKEIIDALAKVESKQ